MSLSTDYSTSASRLNNAPMDVKDINLDALNSDACAVLDFWFNKDNEPYWFEKNGDFDKQIRDRFGELWQAASNGECATWRRSEAHTDVNTSVTSLAGRLAEIIVLDQFSRNLCRDKPCAFTQDGMAVVLAQEAINQPQFARLPVAWRKFMIMPFMHSESALIHERYLPLFEQLEDPQTLDYEIRHKEIIDRFGRYPHRNETLNRDSTPEESAFLEQPSSSF